MGGFEQRHQELLRAKEIFPKVELVTAEHHSSEGFKGQQLTAYEVLLDGQAIGRVLQQVQHTYKVHNRTRYADRYTVRWQYDWPRLESDCRSLYYDTRQKAVIELLMLAIRKGKVL